MYNLRNLEMEMNKKKTCPHCGKEILEGAKKCRYCKTWIIDICPVCGEKIEHNTMDCPYCHENVKEYLESVRENKMISTLHKTYKTKPVSLWLNIFSLAFLYPPQFRLDQLSIDGDSILVCKKKGDDFSAPISDLYFKIEESKNNITFFIKLMYGDKMTRFLRVDSMLSEEEWDELVYHLRKFAHEIGKSNALKYVNILDKIKDYI